MTINLGTYTCVFLYQLSCLTQVKACNGCHLLMDTYLKFLARQDSIAAVSLFPITSCSRFFLEGEPNSNIKTPDFLRLDLLLLMMESKRIILFDLEF